MSGTDLNAVLGVLREQRDLIRDQKRIELLGVFGSVARGEAHADSDVDVLADFLKGATLFDISEAQERLEAALGRPVDLVDRARLREHVRPEVERDFVPA